MSSIPQYLTSEYLECAPLFIGVEAAVIKDITFLSYTH